MHPEIQLKTTLVIHAVRVWILKYYSSLQMKECECKKNLMLIMRLQQILHMKYKYKLKHLGKKFQTSIQTDKNFTV